MKQGKPRFPGGDLELALMRALWARGEASVRELHEDIKASRDVVYTTVAKVLDRLTAKGLVRRIRAGRAFRYRTALDQATVHRDMARDLVARLTQGGDQPAIAALVGALEDISPDMLAKMERAIASRRGKRHGT